MFCSFFVASRLPFMLSIRCSQAAFESDAPIGVMFVRPVRCTDDNHATHAHSACAVAAQASRDSVAITEARRSRIIACPPLSSPASQPTRSTAAPGPDLQRRLFDGRRQLPVTNLVGRLPL